MASYWYKAVDKAGKVSTGTMVMDSEDGVVEKLRGADLIPVTVKPSGQEASGVNKILSMFNKIRASDLNMFTRQFGVLQKAGVSIVSSIYALKEQASNKAFKDALEKLATDIKKGESLSTVLSRHPQFFGPLYINMVKAGEESGSLVDVLERLADLGDYEEKVNMRIKAATRYPLIVITVIVLAFLVLTVMVVPRFAKVYSAANITLPIPTLILIWTNYAITRFWWALLIVFGAAAFGFYKYINTKTGRWQWDGLRLKIPVFGPLMVKITMARFTRVTGTLMRTGVPIMRIMELTSGGVGNVVIAHAIDFIKSGIKEGRGMSGSMKATGLFPPVVIQMVSVGEDTGKMDELLIHVANYYESQAAYTIENMTSLIEPMLLLVLGGGVLTMALGIFLPMWNLMQLFRR